MNIGEWVPVTERLPGAGEDVILFWNSRTKDWYEGVYRRDNEEWRSFYTECDYPASEVTHWATISPPQVSP